jgi:hypothetical protein
MRLQVSTSHPQLTYLACYTFGVPQPEPHFTSRAYVPSQNAILRPSLWPKCRFVRSKPSISNHRRQLQYPTIRLHLRPTPIDHFTIPLLSPPSSSRLSRQTLRPSTRWYNSNSTPIHNRRDTQEPDEFVWRHIVDVGIVSWTCGDCKDAVGQWG